MRRAKSLAFVAVALLLGNAAQAADTQDVGRTAFDAHCAACHQTGGKGVPGLAPPLVGALSNAMASDEGRRYITGVLIHGLSGRITSQGQTFVGAMPPQAALTDADLVSIANYLARDLNDSVGAPFATEDLLRARGEKLSHRALLEMRGRLLR
jgi:mono/diheme cytochrome c family protein